MEIRTALVIGAGSGVGHATASALTAAGVRVLAAGRERDATDPEQVAALLAEADPDLVVVAAGSRPRMASVENQSWESFSAPWNVDVKIAFEVGRAALARPLRPGSTVLIVSSGAGLTGRRCRAATRAPSECRCSWRAICSALSDARGLGIRFVALAPRQFLVGTAIGEAAAAAYGAEAGESPDDLHEALPGAARPRRRRPRHPLDCLRRRARRRNAAHRDRRRARGALTLSSAPPQRTVTREPMHSEATPDLYSQTRPLPTG